MIKELHIGAVCSAPIRILLDTHLESFCNSNPFVLESFWLESFWLESFWVNYPPVVGKTAEARPPRFDVEKLRPWEVMFADEKEYDRPQRGGYTTTLMILDLASDAWFKYDQTSKVQHGDSFRKFVATNQIHVLDYPRMVYTDGCGSMKHLRTAATKCGINHTYIPAYTQSLNEAERIADRAFAAARVHLASTGAPPEHMIYALDHVCYMKLRMATSARRGWLTPYEIIKGKRPSISHCIPF